MSKPAALQRGDIIRVNFDPTSGHEQGGFRPALIVSHSLYNANSSTVVVCPITSRERGWPFEVALPAGLPVGGFVLVDQVKVLDWRARGGRLVCPCPEDFLYEIDARLDVLFKGASSAD